MKPYLITTGVIFALMVLAHVARVFAEGPRILMQPEFVPLTLLAAGLSGWAWWLLWTRGRPATTNVDKNQA